MPACGHKYIGTSATGRNRTYRYYTCFSRVRYGTHGCPAVRLPATETDAAVLQPLCDFYASAGDLIADAITRARQQHRDSHADRRAEHAAHPGPDQAERDRDRPLPLRVRERHYGRPDRR